MPRTEPPAALGEAARAAHELGLAALLGGTLFVLGVVTPAVEAGLVAVDAVLSQEAARRPPAWRRLPVPAR